VVSDYTPNWAVAVPVPAVINELNPLVRIQVSNLGPWKSGGRKLSHVVSLASIRQSAKAGIIHYIVSFEKEWIEALRSRTP
jgi:hypothetical protein